MGAILRPGGPSQSIPTSWFTPEITTPDDTVQDVDIVISIGADEKLLSRLNELDNANAETCTTSGKGSDAKWRLAVEDVIPTLWKFANLSSA